MGRRLQGALAIAALIEVGAWFGEMPDPVRHMARNTLTAAVGGVIAYGIATMDEPAKRKLMHG